MLKLRAERVGAVEELGGRLLPLPVVVLRRWVGVEAVKEGWVLALTLKKRLAVRQLVSLLAWLACSPGCFAIAYGGNRAHLLPS